MQALLVIDVQEALMKLGDFQADVWKIESVIKHFKATGKPVIFIKHVEDDKESLFYKKSRDVEVYAPLLPYADDIIEKRTPSAFFETDLDDVLRILDVDHVVVTGFNAEYCCLFTAISAFDRGYKVTFLEDAIGTVNNADSYEMPGLNICGFAGSVLHWSRTTEVVNYGEYVGKYALK
ncbi:isochorismatase family protein [Priestia taiwanensis]|uniref:Amidase n=1 Tax=Priestia taiwanensis TaxID=1347902 RepID=A0A917EN98_9BACI|nr:isochorismatase family protein [Priestia taiwanensis]MBM7362046.1 nicotinamidase-related amidase [Priestia taiwanensis]GGE59024.1 amidase [Priestia taiwanensis]